MKLYEFEGKQLLARAGIPVPDGGVVGTVDEAEAAAESIGYPVAVKSQVLSGKRGKAGGIRFADTPARLRAAADDLLGSILAGETVERVLIEPKLDIRDEYYLGVTLDHTASRPAMILSTAGGMDVEETAEHQPDQLFKLLLDPGRDYRLHHWLDFGRSAGFHGRLLVDLAETALALHRLYFQLDVFTAEINPLVVLATGGLVAADAKVDVDDSALYRQPRVREFSRLEEELTPLEAEARGRGLAYVGLEGGDVGVIAGGAGLCMASMDMIAVHGGRPANFLDLGGGASREKTAQALELVLRTPDLKGVLLNLFGGINNCEEMARGIVRVLEERRSHVPIVVKMRGHSQDEGWALLEDHQVPVVKYGTTEEAVVGLMNIIEGKV
jgi:succinyl-CoA synthetase beta subunit